MTTPHKKLYPGRDVAASRNFFGFRAFSKVPNIASHFYLSKSHDLIVRDNHINLGKMHVKIILLFLFLIKILTVHF
jgi:hypothetical protein